MLLTRPKILDYVPPGYILRPEQEGLLLSFQEAWEEGVGCIVPVVPVAGGKSLLARTIQGYAEAYNHDSTYCVPDATLQRQVEQSAPELTSVWGKYKYSCPKGGTCADHKERCEGCPYDGALAEALTAKRKLMNFHTLRAQRGKLKYPKLAIFDEAHKILDTLAGEADIRLWQHEHRWPESLEDDVALCEWIETEGRQSSKRWPQLQKAKALLQKQPGEVYLQKDWGTYRGKDQRCLTLKPYTPRHEPPTFWPRSVKRVVAMSATISPLDIHDLGLDRYHQVRFLGCDSPIPPKAREIRALPVLDMRYAKREEAAPVLASYIDKLLDVHPDAGMVHVTYEEMDLYRPLLTNPRFLWHTQSNKLHIYNQWVSGRAGPGRVLVGAGLHEGIDLKGDLARWQVVTRVPTLSLADGFIAARAERQPEWYAYSSVKAFAQAVGRVCRTPDDYGVTYCFDAHLRRLWEKYEYLFPRFVKDALTWLL